MLLLHISDVHFREGISGTALDPNAALLNELIRDAEAECRRLGRAPDAVLLTGDITFAGSKIEFGIALEWLEQLCRRCGADTSNLFMVPGNHDVVRAVPAKSKIIQAFHQQIKQADPLAADNVINGLLLDEEASEHLYKSLENYNAFATPFFCGLLPPSRTSIRRDLELNDGSVLRLTGLNSTFVSSASDKEGDLFVDTSYNQLHREPGVVHLTMCHHPFNWLRQGRSLRDALDNVAHIQLFGHEHQNRIEQAADFVRVYASAALPDKHEGDWEPGYNLIQLHVDGEDAARYLVTTVHVRIWQQRPGRFRAKVDRNENSTFQQTIRLDPWVPESAGTNVRTTLVESSTQSDDPSETPTNPLENQSMQTLREISVRFFKLTLSQKSAIAGQFDLLDEADTKLPDFERFRNALLRAKSRNLLKELDSAIGLVESKN